MKVAAAVNLIIGLALAWLVAFGISLDSPVLIVAWFVTGLMLLAGVGAAIGASWGTRLGQALGVLGALLGALTMAGGIFAFVQGGEFSDLAGAVLLMLGFGLLVGFGLAAIVNSRARAGGG
jgi:hypothetical protein